MGSERNSQAEQFQTASRGRRRGLVREFLGFLYAYKLWWLLPILIVLALVGALVMLSGTALAPWVYTIF